MHSTGAPDCVLMVLSKEHFTSKDQMTKVLQFSHLPKRKEAEVKRHVSRAVLTWGTGLHSKTVVNDERIKLTALLSQTLQLLLQCMHLCVCVLALMSGELLFLAVSQLSTYQHSFTRTLEHIGQRGTNTQTRSQSFAQTRRCRHRHSLKA